MTLEQMEEAIDEVRYKDWSIYINADENGSLFMQVAFFAPNEWGVPELQQGRKWLLSKHMTKSEIVQTALKAVLTAEEHEARENFMYRGRKVFGPHVYIDALWDACDTVTYRDPVG